ncbi:MAG: quinone oxidoreductase family protein [Longimicrobiales bacterium]
MRAWTLRRSGPPKVLELTDVPDPELGSGDVLIRVEAIGINYAEVLSRKGLYGWAPERPYVPGMEVAGRIEVIGPDVVGRSVGERVLCGMQHGGYAERVVVRANRALPAPDHFSMDEAAAFGVNFMTAWVALTEMARLRPDDRVAITAAAGGVGTAAVQIASAFGCDVVALAGSEEKLELTRSLGAAYTVNYRAPDFESSFDSITADRGLDVVLEVVGGDVFRACNARLANFGRLVVVGYAQLDYTKWNPFSWWRAWRDAPRIKVMDAAVASTGLLATHIGYLLPDEERLLGVWSALSDFVAAHDLRPIVGSTWAFEELPEAHRFMESRASTGKLVVRVGQGEDSP